MRSRGHRGALALATALVAAGCGADEGGLGWSGEGTRRSAGNPGEVATERPAPGSTPSPAPTPPPSMQTTPTMPSTPADPGNATVVVRAEKLTARRVIARLIYAEKIEAEATAVADLRKDEGKLWESEGAKAELSFDELRADTIYSKEIRAVHLEAAQVYVKDLKVTPTQGAPDDQAGGEGKDKGKDDKGKGKGKDEEADEDDD